MIALRCRKSRSVCKDRHHLPLLLRVLVRQLSVASLTLVAAACAFAPHDAAAAGYAYSGLASPMPVHGLAATITQLARPAVRSGHVAVWAGVGGAHAGPDGRDEWLQVGIGAMYGGRSILYAEVKSGAHYSFRVLRHGIRPGEPHRVALDEVAPGVWQIVVDRQVLGWRARLDPGAGAQADVAAETWTRGAVCNVLAYRVAAVAVRGNHGWHRLRRPVPFYSPSLTVSRGRNGYELASRC